MKAEDGCDQTINLSQLEPAEKQISNFQFSYTREHFQEYFSFPIWIGHKTPSSIPIQESHAPVRTGVSHTIHTGLKLRRDDIFVALECEL